MDILSEILSSRIRAAIFRLLFGDSARESYMRDLERRSGFSIGAIQAELKKLLRLELLEKRKDGNRVYFHANRQHPLYPEIRNLVLKTNGLSDTIKSLLIGCEDIRFAFIFGSFARNDQTASSDVDLMVIGKVGLRKLTKLLSGLSAKLDREINPHCMDNDEFFRRKNSGDPFVNRVFEEAKLFIIGDDDEFNSMA